MRVISIIASKGGTGKTTLAAHLAVEAGDVAVIDTDPQGSLSAWHRHREALWPRLVAPRRSLEHVLGRETADLVIIDTPPHTPHMAAQAAAVADLVVIPTRPGVLDLAAIGSTVELVGEAKAVIVINATRPRGTITDEAREALAVYGLPVCPTALVHRAAFADALIDGRGVQELAPKGKAAAEVKAVWQWLKRRL